MTALLPLAPSLWTQPITIERETPAERRAHARTDEELALRICAERAPLKIRWRASWKPDKLEQLARLNERGRGGKAQGASIDQLAVNYLRHEKTAYDRIVDRLDGAHVGEYDWYPSVFLIVKRRVHDAIIQDFPWLEEEAERQYERAEMRAEQLSWR
ncbi:hypothetical protein ACXR2T_09995 [Leucobacter sp. HY1910]